MSLDGIDVFIAGVSTGVLLYVASSLVRLVSARKDVEVCAARLETDASAEARTDYNAAAAWYNDRLLHVPSNLLARAIGYAPAPLLGEDASTAGAQDG
ncbi:hypothetical protein ACM64Y_08515 [Novispirillum sp. DQ9]|uniref:hypothetical protein n=1 Tax=Novispirillum sp. DQ9 TaxID=3398612 RepID=UPI003C7BDB8B